MLEEVAIEAVVVGDQICVTVPATVQAARSVLAKRAKSNERTARIVGWLVELAGGDLVWLARGERLWRCRQN